jgi:MFS family permease
MHTSEFKFIAGVGNGMVTLSVFTAFAPYFKKRRALSLGLTASGSGFGMIIIPIILRKLFDNFTFSGAMLLYGKGLTWW